MKWMLWTLFFFSLSLSLFSFYFFNVNLSDATWWHAGKQDQNRILLVQQFYFSSKLSKGGIHFTHKNGIGNGCKSSCVSVACRMLSWCAANTYSRSCRSRRRCRTRRTRGNTCLGRVFPTSEFHLWRADLDASLSENKLLLWDGTKQQKAWNSTLRHRLCFLRIFPTQILFGVV